MAEKKRRHFIAVELLSEKEIDDQGAEYNLVYCMDKIELDRRGLVLVGIRSTEPPKANDHSSPEQSEKLKNGTKLKALREVASRSTGILGSLYALTKGRSWKELYIGGAAGILLIVLAYKLIVRALTGGF